MFAGPSFVCELIFSALRRGKKSGFLHCAAHDKTVIRFGRNDDEWVVTKKANAKADSLFDFAQGRLFGNNKQKGKCGYMRMGGLLAGC